MTRFRGHLIDLVDECLVVALAFATQVVLPIVTSVAQDVSSVHEFEASVTVLDDIDARPAFGQMVLLGVNLKQSALKLATQLRTELAPVV